jgi:hypothetical protein
MTTTMTTVAQILKEVYQDKINDQLQSEVITAKRIESTTEGVTSNSVGGKYVRFAVRVKRNHGIGSRNEMEALPTPRTQGYLDAQVNLTYAYGGILLSGQTFTLAESNSQAFASTLDQEVNGIKEGLRKETNRQFYGTSQGVLAVAASGTTTTFVATDANALQYLEIGMFVDYYDATSTVASPVLNNAAVEITNIDLTTFTVTFGTTVTAVASGDFLVRAGSHQKEPVGFQQIVAGTASTATALGTGAGALYNITSPLWTGNLDTTAGAISEGRMINMVDNIRKRGGNTTVIFTSLGVRRAYVNLLTQQRRYTNTTEFTGGFKGIAFTTDNGDIPLVSDFDCQAGRMYFLNEKELKIYKDDDWKWMNRDGNMWQRVITSSGEFDAYNARLFRYWQLGTTRRNSHGMMTSITEA